MTSSHVAERLLCSYREQLPRVLATPAREAAGYVQLPAGRDVACDSWCPIGAQLCVWQGGALPDPRTSWVPAVQAGGGEAPDDHDDAVEDVVGVVDVAQWAAGQQLQQHLQGEHAGEDDVADLQGAGQLIGLRAAGRPSVPLCGSHPPGTMASLPPGIQEQVRGHVGSAGKQPDLAAPPEKSDPCSDPGCPQLPGSPAGPARQHVQAPEQVRATGTGPGAFAPGFPGGQGGAPSDPLLRSLVASHPPSGGRG